MLEKAFAEVRTARLVLRRPTPADLGFHCDLHSDPRLYAFAPESIGDRAANEEFFAAVQDHWERGGFGYWTVWSGRTGERIGVAGVRPDGDGLNLYYRVAAEHHGHGYGREAAREAVALATEWLPRMPVRAVARAENVPSLVTAERAGLTRVGTAFHKDDDPAGEPSVLLEGPTVERADAFGEDTREAVLDLWCRVNDAGGAVGFVEGAPRDQVAAALAEHERLLATGRQFAGLLRAPGGMLLGLGFWQRSGTPLLAHCLWAYRVMTDPEHRGRNLGRILMAGMHRIARDDGAEIVTLDYRSGTGAGHFYTRCGYTEVGRVPRAIRVGQGDDRDDVIMTRRLDGEPLRPDGRF